MSIEGWIVHRWTTDVGKAKRNLLYHHSNLAELDLITRPSSSMRSSAIHRILLKLSYNTVLSVEKLCCQHWPSFDAWLSLPLSGFHPWRLAPYRAVSRQKVGVHCTLFKTCANPFKIINCLPKLNKEWTTRQTAPWRSRLHQPIQALRCRYL